MTRPFDLRRFRLLAAAVPVCAAVLLAAGCGGPSSDGPLGKSGPGSWSWCVPDHGKGHPITHGDIVLGNHGHETLTIDAITFGQLEGGELIGAYALPLRGSSGAGVGSADGFRPGRPLAESIPGATIAPRTDGVDPGKAAYSFVVGLRRTSALPLKVDGETIRYHDSDGHHYYYQQNGVGYVFGSCKGIPLG